jgi:hypothetical protein
MTWYDSGKNHLQVEDVSNLKICDLCGALNLVSEPECLVCRWHGHFERRPEVVQIALEFHSYRKLSSDLRSFSEEPAGPDDCFGGLSARISALWSAFCRRLFHRRY